MARPKKYDIDSKQVEIMASQGATNTDIAEVFKCTEGLIRKSYSEFLTKGRAERRMKLRRLQWKAAESGNTTMLIWLGKQELGQTDRQEIEHIRPIDEVEFDGL